MAMWDDIESSCLLTLVELGEEEEANVRYKNWALLEEISWR